MEPTNTFVSFGTSTAYWFATTRSITPMHVYRTPFYRLILGWIIVSVLTCGTVYFYRMQHLETDFLQKTEEVVENNRPIILSYLNRPGDARHWLQEIVNAGLDSGFVAVDLYDASGNIVAQKADEEAETIFLQLSKQIPKGIKHDGRKHLAMLHYADTRFVWVSIPLKENSSIMGHFDGIYLMPQASIDALKTETYELLGVVFLATLATALVLYPFIVTLNRTVHAEARTILRGNIELMEVLGSAIAKRDSDTNAHNYRVTLYAVRLAENIGMHRQSIKELIAGAFLHDVGKIGIHDAILLKPGKLTEAEFSIMKQHVELGLDIVKHSAWLRHATDVIGNHHEWYDGNGYPQGLAGEAIPKTARVFAIADVFDALTSQRPYKPALPLDHSLEILQQQAGRQFDPEALEAFMPIAGDLHQHLNQLDEDNLALHLREVVARYWNHGAEVVPNPA